MSLSIVTLMATCAMDVCSYNCFFLGERIWLFRTCCMVDFPNKNQFFQWQSQPLGQQLVQHDLLGKFCILITGIFICANSQRQIYLNHHFYRGWHGNLMCSFPVGIIIAFSGGFLMAFLPRCPNRGKIIWEVCRVSPVMHWPYIYLWRRERNVDYLCSYFLSLKGSTGQRSSCFHMHIIGLLMVPCYVFTHLQSCVYTENVTQAVIRIPGAVLRRPCLPCPQQILLEQSLLGYSALCMEEVIFCTLPSSAPV